MPDEVDGAVHEDPPEVGVLARSEQIDPGLYADLRAALEQLAELLVRQAVEDAERAKVVEAHQVVAR